MKSKQKKKKYPNCWFEKISAILSHLLENITYYFPKYNLKFIYFTANKHSIENKIYKLKKINKKKQKLGTV